MPCGTCLHYEPTRNPETGRPLPTRGGRCRYPVKWPVLPDAYKEYAWGSSGSCYRLPYPQTVYTSSYDNCPTWQQKPGAKAIMPDKAIVPDKPLFGADSNATQTVGK